MFVRFQERNNDGRRPKMVSACLTWVAGKRRSRWRIGVDQGAELQPYRLLVSVIENRRVEGKVRQEHIADLGATISFTGFMLASIRRSLMPSWLALMAAWNNGTARRSVPVRGSGAACMMCCRGFRIGSTLIPPPRSSRRLMHASRC
jgi:hypothetical protein